MFREVASVLFGGVAQRWRRAHNPSAAEYPGVEFREGARAYDCRFGEGVVVGAVPVTAAGICDPPQVRLAGRDELRELRVPRAPAHRRPSPLAYFPRA